MCGGGTGKLLGRAARVALGVTTFGASEALGLGEAAQDTLNPKIPGLPDSPEQGLTPTQVDAAARADDANSQAQLRERRRAARRFGRASTIGAGLSSAPASAGKVAVGS